MSIPDPQTYQESIVMKEPALPPPAFQLGDLLITWLVVGCAWALIRLWWDRRRERPKSIDQLAVLRQQAIKKQQTYLAELQRYTKRGKNEPGRIMRIVKGGRAR